jgi:hypothetical protein
MDSIGFLACYPLQHLALYLQRAWNATLDHTTVVIFVLVLYFY